jgi:hypothetical protein
MDCTLWDALSVEFINNYNQRTETGPAVLIIKHARVKDPQGLPVIHTVDYMFTNYICPYRLYYPNPVIIHSISGVYPVQLTNVWDGTKLLFDPAIPEISAFAQRFGLSHPLLPVLSYCH